MKRWPGLYVLKQASLRAGFILTIEYQIVFVHMHHNSKSVMKKNFPGYRYFLQKNLPWLQLLGKKFALAGAHTYPKSSLVAPRPLSFITPLRNGVRLTSKLVRSFSL